MKTAILTNNKYLYIYVFYFDIDCISKFNVYNN